MGGANPTGVQENPTASTRAQKWLSKIKSGGPLSLVRVMIATS